MSKRNKKNRRRQDKSRRKVRSRCRGCRVRIARYRNVTGLRQHRCDPCADAEYAARLLLCLNEHPDVQRGRIVKLSAKSVTVKLKVEASTEEGEWKEITLNPADIVTSAPRMTYLQGMVTVK